MKSIKTLVLGAMSLAAAATMAHATTELYFTGSTAFRGSTVTAIENIFDSGTLTYGYTGTVDTKQDAGVFSGTIGGTPYIIKTYWTGSEAGIQAVSQDGGTGILLNFPSDTPDKGGVQTALTSSGLQNIDDPIKQTIAHPDTEVPNVDMSDTYQGTSQFRNGQSIKETDGNFHTFATLTGTVVGVVPFDFVISKSGSSSVTNVTTDAVKNLFVAGVIPRALITGNNADENNPVYATGRNPDSGTRLTALTDTGIGTTKTIKQYEPFDSTGAQVTAVNHTIATLELWLPDTVNSIAITTSGLSGYSSGGSLAGAMGSATGGMTVVGQSVTGGDLLTYLSTSDAGTAETGGAGILSYNGVTESNTTVAEGEYTFFGFEHLNVLNTFASSDARYPTVQAIAASIVSTYANVSGILLSTMNVTRAGSTNKDGGAITPSYTNY